GGGDGAWARARVRRGGGRPGGAPERSLWTLPVIKAQAELAVQDNRVGHAQAVLARALPAAAEPGDLLAAWELLVTAAKVARLARVRATAMSQPSDEGFTTRLRQAAACLPAHSPPPSADATLGPAQPGREAAWAPP